MNHKILLGMCLFCQSILTAYGVNNCSNTSDFQISKTQSFNTYEDIRFWGDVNQCISYPLAFGPKIASLVVDCLKSNETLSQQLKQIYEYIQMIDDNLVTMLMQYTIIVTDVLSQFKPAAEIQNDSAVVLTKAIFRKDQLPNIFSESSSFFEKIRKNARQQLINLESQCGAFLQNYEMMRNYCELQNEIIETPTEEKGKLPSLAELKDADWDKTYSFKKLVLPVQEKTTDQLSQPALSEDSSDEYDENMIYGFKGYCPGI